MLLPARETLDKIKTLWRRQIARTRHAPTQVQPAMKPDLWRNVSVWYVTAADAEDARASAIQHALVSQTPVIVKVVSDETYRSLLLEDQLDQDRERLVDEY